jgi:choline dehydrogenase-like flavoprotein
MVESRHDVIVIGTGAGGGAVLSKLAGTGKRILVLERGDHLVREKRNWDPRAVQLEARYDTTERFRDRDGAEFRPGAKYVVGGNTKVWGAALLRMRPGDFEETRLRDGVSPAWPLDYDDFEPYYAEAERLYRVRGRRGVDPTEGPSSAPYPYPPIRHEPRVERLLSDLRVAGVRPFDLPLGLQRDDAAPESSACIRCDTCDGFPCLVRGKADSEVICVEPALRSGTVELRRNAKALRLLTGRDPRRVDAVEVEIDGRIERFGADLFVVACGAIQSAALLLRSRSPRHPAGLGNSSGLLGRNYMTHQNSAVFAISRHENRSVFQKTFAIADWYRGGDDGEPLGLIQPLNRTGADLLAAFPPSVEHERRRDFDWLATHSLEFWTTSEDLPDPDNRVRIDADGAIVVDYRPNNVAAHDRLNARLAALLREIEGEGFDPVGHFAATRMPLSVCSHQCGTMRFGVDPRASVLDLDCRLHDVDNVHVADSSFFPSSAAVNPSLTIVANALRVGATIANRLGARAPATHAG